jgi:cytoskeletal protein CcmA (bactofilin family)
MPQDRVTFWRSLLRFFASKQDLQIVLDRRKGERRQRIQATEVERRREDRRRPLILDIGEVHNFLGERTHFKGELSFGGTVRVDGHLEGELVRGETLIIGERGLISAEIRVEVLQVGGQVQGNITARRWAELLETSQVTGTIRTPRLTIWNGAVFNGECEMPPLRGDESGGLCSKTE